MPPAATVAHEGNPRTNSLTVSGTLDGDIFLIPLPPPPDPVSGTPPEDIVRPLPPPGPPTFCLDAATIMDTDEVTFDAESSIIKVYSALLDPPAISLVETESLVVEHVPGEEAFDITALDYTVLTGECLAGYVICDMIHNPDGAAPQGRETSVGLRYVGPVSGLPMSGLCVAVDTTSTNLANFTGWVLLVNEQAQLTQLMYYLNESLAGLPAASHIVATAAMPAVGSLVQMFYARDSNRIEVYNTLADGTFSQPITYTTATQIVPGTRCNGGLVWVGQSGLAVQVARWDQGERDGFTEAYLVAN
jgi:hypothetical protein